MTRDDWVHRLVEALDAFEARQHTTEQLAAFAVYLETLNGTHGQPKAPRLHLVTGGDAS
ncbi:hypothetical protein [Gordonia sp. (in: high G+C Gram-positive bacteria)]|uniref:hypothetical protein n=1 Tax=Gordonia sp. (in: high G+C Gram-positive bacteria) TaxID=84139 RepID=UPI00257AE09B|nr:hypothetical protein [Gordonia sp. (in: high G+C Gram-positive bacteria)]